MASPVFRPQANAPWSPRLLRASFQNMQWLNISKETVSHFPTQPQFFFIPLVDYWVESKAEAKTKDKVSDSKGELRIEDMSNPLLSGPNS